MPHDNQSTTDNWLTRDHQSLIHSQQLSTTASQAVVWSYGQGAELIDVQGRRYLDGLAGLWNVLVGHGRNELVAAATEQMQRLAFASSFSGATHPQAIELAERLQQLTGLPAWRFFFTSGGGEAVEAALKTARYVWQRRGQPRKHQFLCYDHAYHGTTMATLSATGFTAYQAPFQPTMPGWHLLSTPGTRLGWSSQQYLDELTIRIEQIGADNLAAIIAEPVWGAGGTYIAPPGYWSGLREVCNRYEILLIADEVITAFGRCGGWWHLPQHGVQPDLICFAKGITSGYFPLGGVAFSPDIAQVINSATPSTAWWHALTYSAHPVGCAVALANLDLLVNERLLNRVEQLAKELHLLLRTTFGNDSRVLEIRQQGLLAGIEFRPLPSRDAELSDASWTGQALLQAARQHSLISRVRGSTFQLAPPYVITNSQLQELVQRLQRSVDDVYGTELCTPL